MLVSKTVSMELGSIAKLERLRTLNGVSFAEQARICLELGIETLEARSRAIEEQRKKDIVEVASGKRVK